ncbi:hypothetical protein MPSEU_000200400 [Mayamaea pseudoterrestris]|nr:hypothetical protein MPSEU_000200400 [Mayamaea pseudoterrestris]
MPPFHPMTLLLIAIVLLSFIGSTALANNDIQGNYTLAKLVDADDNRISLHRRKYIFTLESQESTTSNNSTTSYSFGITIGNSIGGSMVVDEAANGTITDMMSWSTRMYPGRRLYKIEVALIDALDQAKRLERKTKYSIVLAGPGGSLTLRRPPAERGLEESAGEEDIGDGP